MSAASRATIVRLADLFRAHESAIFLSSRFRRRNVICVHGANCHHGCDQAAVALALSAAAEARRQIAEIKAGIDEHR